MEYRAIVLFLTLATTVFEVKPLLYSMQLHGYRPNAIFKKNKIPSRQYLSAYISSIVALCVYPIGIIFDFSAIFNIVYSIIFFVFDVASLEIAVLVKTKGKIVYTNRLKRLYVLSIALVVAYATLAFVFIPNKFWVLSIISIPFFAPLLVSMASLLIYPLEQVNNRRYINIAKEKLKKTQAIKIGITGSFGKTSVKNILYDILSKKYRVLKTEGNFNTPLGIAKSLNNLENADVFIAEMGARHVGDIKELTDIVLPDVGIITGITNQHLETFKKYENIVKEKLKILEEKNLEFGVVNKCGITDKIPYNYRTIYVGEAGDFVYAKDVKTGSFGSSFIISIDGKEYMAKTKLLGENNIQNIVTAVTVAVKLKVEIKDILDAIENLKSTPHRLQLLKNGKLTIIDDTYNANPIGVREGLKVLKNFPEKRIVITPGMVELGDDEKYENECFGNEIASVASLVILIGGKPADYVYDGLTNSAFPDEKIMRFSTLQIAERYFPNLFSAGDTVMFINDLPDNYN